MIIRDILRFKEDVFFDGAVQADWFYKKEKAEVVASNFVFHGKDYFGQTQSAVKQNNIIDTISFTQYIIDKVYDDTEGVNPFTLAIAGYGSGKSHLAVTLAELISNNDNNISNRILNNIKVIDSHAEVEIRSKLKHQNLVLTINGMNDFNLNYEILKCARKSLSLYGLDDDVLLSISSACETAKRFTERYFHKNIESFELAAQNRGISHKNENLYDYIINQLGYDDTIYDIVNEVYSDITGHEIRWDQGISAGKILETLSTEFCASRGLFNKIVIIFDEFGRYLEYASSYSSKAGDSALQQIFEAAQNTNGQVQFLGFIQSDIKTYLSRVDQTTNISRYISRYDHSDKLHLSSNLETIFANIIERPDHDLFKKYVSSRISVQSEEIYQKMKTWIPQLSTKGAWSSYDTFKKVICEGIYPFHPLTTYMLSSMSDWLQNRSSLVILSSNIKKFSGECIDDNIQYIFATDILDNELFLEILNAEEEGRQRSRYATIYDNILKKYGDRLSEDEIAILKANLIIKICRFNATSREDAIGILEACSNIHNDRVDKALNYLEVEYGVLSYDDRANTFEFIEDSTGASDFRAFIKRKKNITSCNYDLLSDATLLDILGALHPIPTDFGVKRFITTNEWQFEQKLYLISDFSKALLEKIKIDCVNRFSVDKPKGILIWLYINKEFEYDEIERVQTLIKSTLFENIPIRIFLIDDSQNQLRDYLLDYTVLSEINNDDNIKYSIYINEFKIKLERNLQDCINELKVERKLLTGETIKTDGIPRMPVYLSQVFQDLYPNVIPFSFDGFNGKAATITKTRKLLCSIEKFLCSDLADYLSIKTQTVDVQKRFEIILCGNGPMSWKTITDRGTLISPSNTLVESLYNMVSNRLDETGQLSLETLIDELRRSPYGLNDMAISLFIVVFICINRDRIKLVYNQNRYSVTKWSEIIVDDSNIDLSKMSKSLIMVVDSLDVRKKFKSLFERINGNTDISRVDALEKELNDYLLEEELPRDLEDSLTLAKGVKIADGKRNKLIFNELIGNFKESINRYHETGDVSKIIEIAENNQYPSVNLKGNYKLTENQIEIIKKFQSILLQIIQSDYLLWAEKTLRCREIAEITRFTQRTKKITLLLENLGFNDFARKTREISERESSNAEVVRNRQMVSDNIKRFMVSSNPSQTTSYIILNEWLKELKDLRTNLNDNTSLNKYDKADLLSKLNEREKQIDEYVEVIKNEIENIWDSIYDIESNNDLRILQSKISPLINKQLNQEDMDDLMSLSNFINDYLELDNAYSNYLDNRVEIEKNYEKISDRYKPKESDFDISNAIEQRYQSLLVDLDEKEKVWISKYLNEVGNGNENKLKIWLNETKELPLYLSNITIRKYHDKQEEVKEELKKYRVDYIVALISELSDLEWHEIIKIVNR